MQKFLNLVLSGAVTGAVYSIMASGIVLTYTTSGIFNFAHGAVAFAAAYVYYQLNTGLGIPIVPAALITVLVFAPALGLLLDRILLRRLAQAPVYARIVGTIGLLVALPALLQWLVVTVGNDTFDLGLAGNPAVSDGEVVPGIGPTPAKVYHPLDGVAINTNQIAVWVAAAVAAIGLWYLLRRTRVGLEMRAVVDRESLAQLRGVNAARSSAVAWVLTMVLAGLGGILIAPLFELSDVTFTLVVLGSLAAVVLGGLRSLPIAFVGGLLLGIVQNLIAGYDEQILPSFLAELSGLRSAVPYVLVLVLGLVIGRDRSRKAGTVADDVPRPDHRQGLSALRRRLPWAVFTIVFLAYSLGWVDVDGLAADTYTQTVIAQSLAMAIVFLSFVIITGMGGMVSLAQTTFVTAGGFAAGWALSRDWGVDLPLVANDGQINFLWATLIGVVVAAALGALIALPATRLGGVFLALWSLAAAFFFSLVVFAYEPIGKGQLGWTIRAPSLDVPVLNWVRDLLVWNDDQKSWDFAQLPDQILLFLGIFGLLTLMIHSLLRSPTGRAMLAVRSSEVAARSSGIRSNHTKLAIFALSAGVAGLGGTLLGIFSYQVNNGTAPPLAGLYWLALAVLFGIRRPGGALLAGLAFAAGTALLHWISGFVSGETLNDLLTSPYFIPMLAGLGAIQLAQEPDGILALVGHQRAERRRARERQQRIEQAEAALHDGTVPDHVRIHERVETSAAAPTPALPDARDTMLALEGIVAGYGDVEVLHGVDLRVAPGEIVALLGPNGAGKSTLCNVAAGAITPTTGRVLVDGTDVTREEPYVRARAGLILVPEARGIFPGLTVDENLMVLLRQPEQRERAYERFPRLAERRKQTAAQLSGGEQQMLSLAPTLVDPPRILVADEPTLGLAPMIADQILDALLELRETGTAILMVDEHVGNAMRVADTIVVMDLGTVAWTGRPEDADQEALAASYLGGARSRRLATLPTADR